MATVAIPTASSQDIKNLPLNSYLKLTGTVAVEPNILGKSVFYLAGPNIQVYKSDGQIPSLKRGDSVSVIGKLGQREGEVRLKADKGESIAVQSHSDTPLARTISIGDLDDDAIGELVTVSGSVSEAKWPTFYLSDGDGEFRVYVVKSTGLVNPLVHQGDKAQVTGLVSKTTAGLRLLPRDASDIVIANDKNQVVKIGDRLQQMASWQKYFVATTGVVLLGGFGLAIQGRMRRRKKQS